MSILAYRMASLMQSEIPVAEWPRARALEAPV
jgi:hypothetical protein